MIRRKSQDIAVVAGGGTVNITTTDNIEVYKIIGGGVTLLANFSIAITGTPQENDQCIFVYEPSVTPGVNGISILGTPFRENLLASKCLIEATYNGTSWDVSFAPNFGDTNFIIGGNLQANTLTSSQYGALSVDTAAIAASAVTSAKLAAANRLEVVTLDLSFAAADQGAKQIYMPYAGALKRYFYTVTEDIAATDDATVAIATVGGPVGFGAITIPASTLKGATGTTGLAAPNDTFVADSNITVTSAKVTPGGKIFLCLIIERS